MNESNWGNSKIDKFTVEFLGDEDEISSITHNEIEAKKLALSLMGISSVLEESNIRLNGSNSQIFVKVKGSFEPGSFIVQLALLLTSGGLGEIADLITILGFCGLNPDSLIQFFKKTKGKKIVNKTKISGNNYSVTVEDSDSPIIVNGDVILLYQDGKVRKEMSEITSVLDDKEISKIKLYSKGNPPETIFREERNYFKYIESVQMDEIEGIDYFLITRPDFEGRSTGWRVSSGETDDPNKQLNDFFVTISDKNFLLNVKFRRIVITQGTVIKAKFKKTLEKLEKFHRKVEIIEVIEVLGEGPIISHNKTLFDVF